MVEAYRVAMGSTRAEEVLRVDRLLSQSQEMGVGDRAAPQESVGQTRARLVIPLDFDQWVEVQQQLDPGVFGCPGEKMELGFH